MADPYRVNGGGQHTRALGKFDNYSASERFNKALAAAREWLTHFEKGGATQSVTVMEACDAYVNNIRALKGDKATNDLEDRYRRQVKPAPINKIKVTKLTSDTLSRFRRLVDTPVKVGTLGETRARFKDTVNRDMAAVRAALNQTLQDGLATSDLAWRIPLAAFKNVTRRRGISLDRAQRKMFIDKAPADLAQLIRALCLLPLRPGDFDILKVGKDKSGSDRKFKVPAEIAHFFRNAAADRPADAPLVARAGGQASDKDAWKHPLKLFAKQLLAR
ncbi:hypothetical protein [Massilia sp. PWRC2]|uniref:hypothetical protein n=1 Tax=Massilia sp. PWRC2 TaxID=2804626 RepID=UPI003CF2D045